MANSVKYNAYKIPTEGELDGKYVDFSSAQSITGTKTFDTIKTAGLFIGGYFSWCIEDYTNHGKTWELLAPDNNYYSIQLGDCGFTVDVKEGANMFQVDNAGVHIGRGRLDDTDYPVDKIVNSIDSSSTDKQLATAKAIFSFFQPSAEILRSLKMTQSAGYNMDPDAKSTVSSYVQIGNILICWGVCHPALVGNDTTTTVLFPQSFYWRPTVIMQNTNKDIAIQYRNGQVLTGLTKSSFSYYNSAGETSNILWIAIGKAQSF